MTLLICCLFAILSRNVATARIGRLRTPFGDLQKREGLIKEASPLAPLLTLVFDAPVLPDGYRRLLVLLRPPSGVFLRLPPTTVMRSG